MSEAVKISNQDIQPIQDFDEYFDDDYVGGIQLIDLWQQAEELTKNVEREVAVLEDLRQRINALQRKAREKEARNQKDITGLSDLPSNAIEPESNEGFDDGII